MSKRARLWQKTLGDYLSPGDVIADKYRLERVLGAGGMGVVIEARHVELDAQVAVKVLRPDRNDATTAQERFRREAQAAFRITSEHVARVLDLGTLDGDGLYLVMEYLDGRDLSQVLLKHGRFPVGTAVGIILQVCEAVAEAHSLGIVHRDLKPENIFICQRADGTPCTKVIDFGLAKVEGRLTSLTGMNRGLGTPRYMSPEQWVSARDVGGGADIWALGVILFELVTGRSPFDDDDINELCQSIIAGPVPRASRAQPDLPKGIDDVISRCLMKKPADRYATASELAADLVPFAQLLPSVRSSMSTVRPPAPAPMWLMSPDSSLDTSVTSTDNPTLPQTRKHVTTVKHADPAGARELGDDGETIPDGVPLAPIEEDPSGEWAAAPDIRRAPRRNHQLWAGVAAAGLLILIIALVSRDSPSVEQTRSLPIAETISHPAAPLETAATRIAPPPKMATEVAPVPPESEPVDRDAPPPSTSPPGEALDEQAPPRAVRPRRPRGRARPPAPKTPPSPQPPPPPPPPPPKEWIPPPEL